MTPSDDRDPVDVLAEEFADQLRRGEHPSVGDYAAAHPDLADRLREVLPAVARMEQLKRFRKATAGGRPGLPDRLGDFRIVRELGRGGMGVVFEAVQESLGRRVALKVLAAQAQLDPAGRERFVREAKAAARLHHTNVVPVFGVGEQDGLPYYVMQLIPGRGLNALLAGWRKAAQRDTRPADGRSASTLVAYPRPGRATKKTRPKDDPPPPAGGPRFGDWSFVARVGIQAADALQYAHDQGVLHRDVKPGNLLLDDGGRVWVADFGLAKLVDQHGLTATGDVLGTLQYLAPEGLHGEADARTDVYGLGATLYELITLDPPFDADSPVRLMKQIEGADPRPPRALNPDIPRDLETIVLKALAREPGRRYASAGDLADDLRAFLDDRPIRARRTTAIDRGWRWCRRNPAVAVLASSTLAALLLAAVVGWVGYARTRGALRAEAERRDEAEQARNEAVEASRKLEANLRLSLAAFEKVFEAAGGTDPRAGVGPRPPGPPGGPPGGPRADDAADKAAVLEAVLEFYDKFAEQNATQPRLRLEAGKAHRRVGEVHLWLGRPDRAAVSFRRSVDLLDRLAAEYPQDEEIRFELMVALAGGPAAEPQLLRAAELGRAFAEPPRRWSVGTVHLKLGWVREQAGNAAGAEPAYRSAVDLLAWDPDRRPPPPHAVVERALARQRLAVLFGAAGRWADARRVLEEAAGELGPMTTAHPPPPPPVWESLFGVYQQLAGVLDQLGEWQLAERYRADANRLLNSLGGPPPKKGEPPPPKGKGPGDPPPKKGPPGGPGRGPGPPPKEPPPKK